MFAFFLHRSLTYGWGAFKRMVNFAVPQRESNSAAESSNDNVVSETSPNTDTENGMAVSEADASSDVQIHLGDDEVVFRIVANLKATHDGVTRRFVAFKGKTEDWIELKSNVEILYSAYMTTGLQDHKPEDADFEQETDAHVRMQKSLTLVKSFTSGMLHAIRLRLQHISRTQSRPSLDIACRLWHSHETIDLIRFLQTLCSRFKPGGLADCAFRFCKVLTLWVESANDCVASQLGGKDIRQPCLYIDVKDQKRVARHSRTQVLQSLIQLDENTEFELFVELEPSKKRLIAFDGNLNKWRSFLDEFQKQLTRRMRSLERNTDLQTCSDLHRYLLRYYETLQPFLKDFFNSSSNVEAFLSAYKGKVQFWSPETFFNIRPNQKKFLVSGRPDRVTFPQNRECFFENVRMRVPCACVYMYLHAFERSCTR